MLIELTEKEAARLARPVRGKGGLQALLRRIQATQRGRSVILLPLDAARIKRYVTYDPDGGFETRLPVDAMTKARLLPAKVKPAEEE